MPNKRDLKLDGYGISTHRYHELKSFCLQYQEWQDKLKYNTDTVQSKTITDMPICHNAGDATSNLVMKRIELFNQCEMIEQTLIKALGDTLNKDTKDSKVQDNIEMIIEKMYPRMLKAITNDDINYAYLDESMNIPCGRNTYWKIRRYFFFLLSEKRK